MVDERLSIDEAAAHLGLSAATVRRRVKAGTLRSLKESTDSGFRYVVLIDRELEHAPPTQGDQVAAAVHEVTIAALREKVSDLERERDWLRTQVEEQRRTIAGHDDQVNRFQTLLNQAHQEQLALREALQSGSGAAAAPPTREDAQSPTSPADYTPATQDAVTITHPPTQPGAPAQRPVRARRAPLWRRLLRTLAGDA